MKTTVKAKCGRHMRAEPHYGRVTTRGGSKKKAAPVKLKRARLYHPETPRNGASAGGNGGHIAAEHQILGAAIPAKSKRARRHFDAALESIASTGGNGGLYEDEPHASDAVIPAKLKRARQTRHETHKHIASTGGNGGHYGTEDLCRHATIPAINPECARHPAPEDQTLSASIGGDDCHVSAELHAWPAIIPAIQGLWRRRQMWVKARTSLTLQAKAECRRACDGDKAAGAELFKRIQKNEALSTQLELDAAHSCGPILVAHQVLDNQIKPIEKKLISLASQLPIAQWARTINGFGVDGTSLAGLIGECGDIGGYATVSKLWKRLGLAVIKGERQRKKSNVEEALEHGYNPPRHAVAWNVSQSLFKAKVKNDYGAVYEYRREHTAETHPDWTPKHAQNDAVRYMLKRFILHLWAEWRRRSNAYGPAYE